MIYWLTVTNITLNWKNGEIFLFLSAFWRHLLNVTVISCSCLSYLNLKDILQAIYDGEINRHAATRLIHLRHEHTDSDIRQVMETINFVLQ